jgi:carboxylesterase
MFRSTLSTAARAARARAPRSFRCFSAAPTDELRARFEAAASAPALSSSSPPATLLRAYALFKQARVGDAAGARPSLFDPTGRAKFDAWAALMGVPREQAMAE